MLGLRLFKLKIVHSTYFLSTRLSSMTKCICSLVTEVRHLEALKQKVDELIAGLKEIYNITAHN